jgi:hypothetical protein
LKYFDIASHISPVGYWHEFLWTGDTLKIAECNDPTISKHVSKFIEDHAVQDFPKTKHLFIYRSHFPDHIGNLLFSNAKKIEAFSTDLRVPAYSSRNLVYNNLKILKLWSFKLWKNESESVHLLSKSFPYVETFLICEGISEVAAQLIENSLRNLRDFRHSLGSYSFHPAFPPNEKLFRF